MKIGILSDTHGQVQMTSIALRQLQDAGAEFFIHCGDVGGAHIVDLLAGLPAVFVWGNTDYDRHDLQRYAKLIGVSCHGAIADLQLDGKRICVLHGDDHRARSRILAEQTCDYLLQGHTHHRDDSRAGRIRLINPGALHRAAEKTVALLDTRTDSVRFFPVFMLE